MIKFHTLCIDVKQVFFMGCLLFSSLIVSAQTFERQPVEAVQAVADKTLRDVPFAFRAILKKPGQYFRGMNTLNLERTFPMGEPGVAYALSTIKSERTATLPVEVSHSDGLKIWLNGKVVYEKQKTGPAVVREEERDVFLETTIDLPVQEGNNELLIKSESAGQNWKVFLRPRFPKVPEGQKQDNEWMELSIGYLPHITEEVAKLSNWLVIGPFPNADRKGLSIAYPPEEGFILGRLYEYNGKEIAWQLPKVEILADVIDAHPLWGTLYDWNYHTAGYAWAIRNLGEFTKEQKYIDYLSTYCDFMLDIKPYIGYEKYTLHRPYSRHTHLWNTPLLDFTSAPALPFIYRLRKDAAFEGREAYAEMVEATQDYLMNEQIRMPDGTFTRETPFKYTTWVDDMFMGIPFLLQSALLSDDPAVKKQYFDDAASQVLGFHKRVYDPSVDLYMHAQYSERPEAKLPYWSRANGWGIWATTEVLLYLPEDHPKYKAILEIYRNHVDGIVKMQDQTSGFYHNVLNHPDSFEETSGTAIFTMAIARGINEGWIKDKKYRSYALNGWKALDSIIDTDGTVSQICMGTMCTEDVQYYYERPVVKDDSHGLLGLIFAGIEVQKLLNK
ncbi:MAG: glycoside hydrolase family 88 protein [Phaeodactylibacter sp.]|nr:glycoside hydrolase family 88 protein [Phaeodactylibacter sp.]